MVGYMMEGHELNVTEQVK